MFWHAQLLLCFWPILALHVLYFCTSFSLFLHYFWTTLVLIVLFLQEMSSCFRVYKLYHLVYFGYWAQCVYGFQYWLYILCSCRYKLNICCIISHILDNGCWVGFGSWCTVTLTHPSSGTMSRRTKTHLIMTILGADSSSKTDTICLLLCFYSENILSVCVCLSVNGGLEGWESNHLDLQCAGASSLRRHR